MSRRWSGVVFLLPDRGVFLRNEQTGQVPGHILTNIQGNLEEEGGKRWGGSSTRHCHVQIIFPLWRLSLLQRRAVLSHIQLRFQIKSTLLEFVLHWHFSLSCAFHFVEHRQQIYTFSSPFSHPGSIYPCYSMHVAYVFEGRENFFSAPI